jgi:hypothetical protein
MQPELRPELVRRAFADDGCPHCGSDKAPELAFCNGCLIGGWQVKGEPLERLYNGPIYRQPAKPDPHFHKTCRWCGYEWLSHTRVTDV